MRTVSPADRGGNRPRRPDPADRLHDLAQRVARLGRGCRDPEAFVVEKLTVAAELRQLAREVRT
jgi:hypothetical protein